MLKIFTTGHPKHTENSYSECSVVKIVAKKTRNETLVARRVHEERLNFVLFTPFSKPLRSPKKTLAF